MSSGCNKFGSINRRAALFEHTMCQCCDGEFALSEVTLVAVRVVDGTVVLADRYCCKFGAVTDCIDRGLDDVNPGGASTPSAISKARRMRAFLSQSSIG